MSAETRPWEPEEDLIVMEMIQRGHMWKAIVPLLRGVWTGVGVAVGRATGDCPDGTRDGGGTKCKFVRTCNNQPTRNLTLWLT